MYFHHSTSTNECVRVFVVLNKSIERDGKRRLLCSVHNLIAKLFQK